MSKGRKWLSIFVLSLFIVFTGYCQSNPENSNCQIMTVEGRVVETDWVGSILVVESFSNNFTFKVSNDAKIINGTERVSFGDVEASDPVTVNYYEDSSGNFIAKSITLRNILKADW